MCGGCRISISRKSPIARRLAQLLNAGCSLRTIDRRLAEFARLVAGRGAAAGRPGLVIEGRRLFLRRGDELAEPGGQLLLDFDRRADEDDDAPRTVISMAIAAAHPSRPAKRRAATTADRCSRWSSDCSRTRSIGKTKASSIAPPKPIARC